MGSHRLALAVLACALAAGCGGDDVGEDAISAARDQGVLLSEVSDDAEALHGHTVTISGAVERRLGDRALVLGAGSGAAADSVLVLARRPLDPAVQPGDVIAVTGVVRPFERVDLARHGVAPGAVGGDVRAGGVVVARRIDRDPPERAASGGDTESPRPSAFAEEGVTIGAVLARPEAFAGRDVTVSGEVERVLSPHAFLLGDQGLLVVALGESGAFREATGVVTGEVRRLSRAELERELDVELDALGDFERRPVLVAERVRLVR